MPSQSFDVIVVGASLAGCTAAILLAREGIKVAVVERHGRPDAHKQLCTHFIQPSALPVLQRLGADRLIEEAGGVRNPIEVHVPSGWVGFHLGNEPDGAPDHGYNLRRLRLDPIMRELAASTPGVTMLTDCSAKALLEYDDRITGVELGGRQGSGTLHARLVVAADGRNSQLAGMAGVTARTAPNRRFGMLVPMRHVDLQRGETSQMWLTGPEAAYVFPNDDGVAVIAWIGPKERIEAGHDRPVEALKERIRSLPDAPQLQQAEPAGEVLMVKDHPNLWRPPVIRGMALAGDALTSVDYLWGVGCGWAYQTGAWLCDAVAVDLKSGADLAAGLKRYARQCSSLAGHRFIINDFARRGSLNPIERLMFAAATKDAGMARHVNRFGARIDGAGRFLAPSALLKAAWINLRQLGASPGDTRSSAGSSATPAQITAPSH